jgi:hypothetical protein
MRARISVWFGWIKLYRPPLLPQSCYSSGEKEPVANATQEWGHVVKFYLFFQNEFITELRWQERICAAGAAPVKCDSSSHIEGILQ